MNNKLNKLINKTRGKLISEKILYKGNYINVIEEDQLLPNGKLIKREKIIKNKGKNSVIIIAITRDNRFILVCQNRINSLTTLEFPSGYIEDKENVIDASKRELLEEIGYASNKIEIIDNYINSISIDGSSITIVVAYNCKKASPQHLGSSEYINYLEFSFDEVKCLIESDCISSGGNRLAFYKYLYMKTTKML